MGGGGGGEGGGGGGAARHFFSSFFLPCSADHERDRPPCKVVSFGLATNALKVRNNNTSLSRCSLGLGNERADAGRDGGTRLARPTF